ncbi:hypothetical protein BRAS3809_6720001 [Bradyrhizobium sp. STM 3809]|nr:hypothetical protein BRAS3809_6720001 [Bradyrhizobium sp. STM 3809]
MDGRDKPGHDDAEGDERKTSIALCDSLAVRESTLAVFKCQFAVEWS